MKRLIVLLLTTLFLSACAAGMYSGGGWTEDDSIGAPKEGFHPSFAFSVDTCHDHVEGVFSFVDANWEKHPVHIKGHVLNFGNLENFEGECDYFALLDYESLDLDEEYQGEGHAVACFTDDDHVLLSIQSGPFKGYERTGLLHSVMVEHACGDGE